MVNASSMARKKKKKERVRKEGDVPGGPGVKNLPCNAGDPGSIPGPGRAHMPQSHSGRAVLSTEPSCSRNGAPQQEKPSVVTRSPLTTTKEQPLLAVTTEKACTHQ